jgi:hypothetical protein
MVLGRLVNDKKPLDRSLCFLIVAQEKVGVSELGRSQSQLARLGMHKATIPVLPRAKIGSARAKDRFSARQVPYDIAN